LRDSIKEALAVVIGPAAGVVIAVCGLAGIVVATIISAAAAAVASAALLVAIVAVFVYALRQRTLFAGPYRVIDETVTWEFTAPDGLQAFHSKRQQVVFNYLVIAHIELASGDGDLFADFTCNYGALLKRFSRDSEEGVLIELTKERTRNEKAVLESKREIWDGFRDPEQWITHKSSMPSKRTELVVKFPKGHTVQNVQITGPLRSTSRPAKTRELHVEEQRQVLRLKPRPYRANQSIEVSWTW
jgi:hypothetical protein